MKKSFVVASVCFCLLAGACGVRRYPIVTPLPADAAGAMSCKALVAELDAGRQTERRIAEIASAGRSADGARPRLYSTARPDADRAVQARIGAIEQAIQTRNCPASH